MGGAERHLLRQRRQGLRGPHRVGRSNGAARSTAMWSLAVLRATAMWSLAVLEPVLPGEAER